MTFVGLGSTDIFLSKKKLFEIMNELNNSNLEDKFEYLKENMFETYVCETDQIYVQKYPWYPMPPTIHKILLHGPFVIANALLPIGQLSEEAQEARNKDFWKFREGYTCKISRTKTNEDILNLLLIASDPYLSSIRKLPQTKFKKLSKEVLHTLDSPDIHVILTNEENADFAKDSCETLNE